MPRAIPMAVAVVALLAVAAEPPSAVTSPSFHASIRPLSAPLREQLTGSVWHKGCPVSLAQLRVLRVSTAGFDGGTYSGSLVVNQAAARPLVSVFRRLYALRWPIRHMRVADAYGPVRNRPRDGDISGSFECREAVPSPCTGGKGTGTWSNHAYGYAIDLNPRENPYVGCGMTRDPNGRKYLDRSRLRPGMVTPAVVAAFRSIGWGWGGAWTGDTRDYMHFSVNGR